MEILHALNQTKPWPRTMNHENFTQVTAKEEEKEGKKMHAHIVKGFFAHLGIKVMGERNIR